MEITNKNISFGMLKKSRLNNIEKVFAGIFKPPLEKMNNIEDLYNWAGDHFISETAQRTDMKGIQDKLDLWAEKLTQTIVNRPDKNLWKAIIFNVIKKTDIYYPDFNPKIIIETINQIIQQVNKDGNFFNFLKIYEKNLRNYSLKKYFPPTAPQSGWIKFSKTNNETLNNEIIADIRNLSIGTKWCTKSKLYAEDVIEFGDFFILYKNGKPALGIRTQHNKIYEIKNILNKPEYTTFKQDINELLQCNPELQIFRDNISMLDNF